MAVTIEQMNELLRDQNNKINFLYQESEGHKRRADILENECSVARMLQRAWRR